MKKIMFPFLIAVTLGFTAGLRAEEATTSNRRVVIAQTNHINAKVQDINHSKREITLELPSGRSKTFTVSDEVKRFNAIKKGDEVHIAYAEAVAFSLRKPGEPAPTTSTESKVTRHAGEKPSATISETSEITATVEDIDRDKREVTLKGPRGNVVTLEVDPDVGDLSRIKKGDKIIASYQQALAISVEKPEH